MVLELVKSTLGTERILPDVAATYALKLIYHNLFLQKSDSQQILFIFGCQRSGTSLMNRIFTRDFRVSVYREASGLSSPDDPKGLRLKPFDQLKEDFHRNKAPYLVLKPLVESQNALDMLNYFPNAKGLWMYRDYKDVVQSGLRRFNTGVGLRDLKHIIDRNPQNWRSEHVSEEVRSIVLEHYSEDMSMFDAVALFWFVRNQLFFEQNFDQDHRVLICQYEELVQFPNRMISQIYDFMEMDYSKKDNFTQEVNVKSVGKGESVEISPKIEALCEGILKKLNTVFINQTEPLAINTKV